MSQHIKNRYLEIVFNISYVEETPGIRPKKMFDKCNRYIIKGLFVYIFIRTCTYVIYCPFEWSLTPDYIKKYYVDF